MPDEPAPFVTVFSVAEGDVGRLDLVVRREGERKRLHVLARPTRSETREVFLARANETTRIDHRNVLPAVEVGEDYAGPYLWHAYVEGVTADDLVQDAAEQGEPIPVQVAVRIALQMAEGLGAAASLPGALGGSFVLAGYDGVVRLTGLAVGAGDLGYSAPELLRGGTADGASDLFAFGVILHELLIGARLYPREDGTSARRILDEPTPDVGLEREDVPVGVVELMFELLAKDPSRRPPSPAVVAHRLSDVLRELVTEEGPIEIGEWLEERFGEARDARRRTIADAVVPLEEGGL